MTTEQNQTNWLTEEIKASTSGITYETLPALKLVPNKIAELTIDFSKPFPTWTDPVNKNVKAIIPVVFNGEKLSFWLNKRNPLYHQLLELGSKGQTKFKVLQTGTQKETRYNLVD